MLNEQTISIYNPLAVLCKNMTFLLNALTKLRELKAATPFFMSVRLSVPMEQLDSH